MTTATKVAIKPLEDRIVVQANEAETTTASGLVIPDTAKEKPQEGTVLAVGAGRFDDKGTRIPVDVQVGDVTVGVELAVQRQEAPPADVARFDADIAGGVVDVDHQHVAGIGFDVVIVGDFR